MNTLSDNMTMAIIKLYKTQTRCLKRGLTRRGWCPYVGERSNAGLLACKALVRRGLAERFDHQGNQTNDTNATYFKLTAFGLHKGRVLAEAYDADDGTNHTADKASVDRTLDAAGTIENINAEIATFQRRQRTADRVGNEEAYERHTAHLNTLQTRLAKVQTNEAAAEIATKTSTEDDYPTDTSMTLDLEAHQLTKAQHVELARANSVYAASLCQELDCDATEDQICEAMDSLQSALDDLNRAVML